MKASLAWDCNRCAPRPEPRAFEPGVSMAPFGFPCLYWYPLLISPPIPHFPPSLILHYLSDYQSQFHTEFPQISRVSLKDRDRQQVLHHWKNFQLSWEKNHIKSCKAMLVPVLSMKRVLYTISKWCLSLGTFRAALNSPGETRPLSTSSPGKNSVQGCRRIEPSVRRVKGQGGRRLK